MKKIGGIDYVAYACTAIVYILPQYLLGSFLSAYYTDVALVPAGAVGAVVLAMRMTDGISDLVMGRVIDKTNTRWGKARPWMLVGTIGLVITLLTIFHVPAGWGSNAKVAYLAVTYFLIMTVFGTVQGVSSNTMMIYLTNDTRQRNIFGASNMAGVYIGGLVATTITSVLLSIWGYTQGGYDQTMVLYVVVVLVIGVFGTVRLKERCSVISSKKEKEKGALRKVLLSMVHNHYYLYAVLAGLLINLITGITAGMGVYFCRDIFGSASLYTIVTLVLILPTLIGLPFSVKLAKRWGHQKTLMDGRIGYMVGVLLEAVGLFATSLLVFLIGVLICGLCSSTFAACFTARVANICDYNEWKYHSNASGTLMSATSFCNKVGLGLGSAITGIILALAKYDGAAANAGLTQSSYTIAFERFSVALIPLILNIVVAFCLSRSNVDPEMEKVRKGLKAE